MNITAVKLSLLAVLGIASAGLTVSSDTPVDPVRTPTPATVATTVTAPRSALPHCQVPCGVYADQMRFEQMLEDKTTIAKAITAINEFADGLQDAAPSAKGLNQVNRWIQTKEMHASNTQKIVAEYFLTQRIKEANKDYSSQLITAHKVMVAAMKCKQDANAETAAALEKSILDLYRAYEGKEPEFNHKEK